MAPPRFQRLDPGCDQLVRVREAWIGEEDRILPLYEWLFDGPGYEPPGWDASRAKVALAEAIAAPESAVLVAEDDEELIGFCTAYLELNSVRFGQRCWVEDLAVDPERRSEGTGGALLDAAAQWAQGAGATHIELDTGLARSDAQRFYQRREPDSVGYSYSWRL
jgi:GNAT superfamily N-acetyltransferase